MKGYLPIVWCGLGSPPEEFYHSGNPSGVNIPKNCVHSEVDCPNIGMFDWEEIFQLFGLEEEKERL